MKLNKRIAFVFFVIFLFIQTIAFPNSFTVSSPNQSLKVELKLDDALSYKVLADGQVVLSKVLLYLDFIDESACYGGCLTRQDKFSVEKVIQPLFGINDNIKDHFNGLRLTFGDGKSFEIRVYNGSVAHRFNVERESSYILYNEGMNIFLEENVPVISDVVKSSNNFNHPYEGDYVSHPVNDIGSNHATLPMIIETPHLKTAVMEAGLEAFPALYFTSQRAVLTSVHPPYPLEEKVADNKFFLKKVTKSAEYIAKGTGPKSLPWRILSFVREDKDLLNNEMVFLLAPEAEGDFSWVKPGKVAWDWYNDNNLWNVPFKSGVNTETYLYYIDFAAKYGIEYINIDEGWSDNRNLLDINDEIDLPRVINYAKKKNVGVFLWTTSTTLLDSIDTYLNKIKEWGANGIKVDFFQRDDQIMIENYETIARKAAERKLLVNFHGATKPTGLSRKYPNVLNYEAVKGLEYNKFDDGGGASPDQVAFIPFIRALAGPMDYTPGGMQYLNRDDWRPIFNRPFTQGTRMQQLALYVLFYAPLQMLADSPMLYEQDPKITGLISSIPVNWDETVPIAGIIGAYAIIARRKGNRWYVAGVNSWQPKDIKLDLNFILAKKIKYTLWSDGANADQIGEDYRVQKGSLKEPLQVSMASGGGFLLMLEL